MKKLVFCVLAIFSIKMIVFAQDIESDTLFLNDGTYLTGKILNPNSQSTLRIKNTGGAVLYIQKERINKVVIVNPEAEIDNDSDIKPPEFEDEKVGISFRMGAGLPYGDFSSASSVASGFATFGWTAEAGLWVKVIEDIYWNNKVSYSRNNLKREAFEQQQELINGVNFVNGIYKPWTGWHFQTGIGYQSRFDEKLTFLFEGVFGFSRFTSPTIILFTDQFLEFRLDEAKGTGFNSSLGVSLKYLNKYTFGINIFSSNPIFVFSGTQSSTIVQPIRIISINLGVHLFAKSKY